MLKTPDYNVYECLKGIGRKQVWLCVFHEFKKVLVPALISDFPPSRATQSMLSVWKVFFPVALGVLRQNHANSKRSMTLAVDQQSVCWEAVV